MKFAKLSYLDMNVSALCLGGMSFGTSKWMADRDSSLKIIKKAIDEGINFIDTANIYSLGESEKIIGEAIQGYRDRIVLSTKGGGKFSEVETGFNRKALKKSLKESLSRLRTDYVDIYLLHIIFDTVDFPDTVSTLKSMIDDGSVRYYGVSNFLGYQIAEFYTLSDIEFGIRPVIIQNHYNAVYREDERDVIPFSKKKRISYSPFSPMAAGFLSGKYRRNGGTGSIRTESYPVMKDRYFRDYDFDVLEAVEKIADEKGVKSSQIALSYVLAKGFIPVIGVNKIEYLEDDIQALDIHLTDEDIREIEEKYVPHKIIMGTAGY
ncbi:MAG: aldo/keto reductase [Thermoplasmata archaeon]